MTLYEITAIVLKSQDDGTQKKQTEKYLVRLDTESLLVAVDRGMEALAPLYADVEVTAAKKTKIVDIFGTEGKEGLYDAKVSLITIDEKTAKEKRTTIEQVVWADSLDEARKIVEAEYNKTLLTYKITDIHETAFLDIF